MTKPECAELIEKNGGKCDYIECQDCPFYFMPGKAPCYLMGKSLIDCIKEAKKYSMLSKQLKGDILCQN